jgi:small subunit ribosomal protein S1
MSFNENFWLDVESEQLKIKRKENKAVKAASKDKIFYYNSDAQQKYDLYCGYSRNYKEPVRGSIIEAELVSIVGDTAIFDLDYREFGFMDLKKESDEYRDYFKVGNRLSIKIGDMSKNYIPVSFTESASENKFNELKDAINKPIAFNAKVTELVSAGYMLDIEGIKVFMPGSLAGLNKLNDFTQLLGKEMPVCIVNYSREKNTLVVSHRQYLHFLIPSAIEKLKADINKLQLGFVTGTNKYGVFCEFNECLTGMIHVSDLTEELKRDHAEGKIKPGDILQFYIKEIINNFKIILTQFYVESPWEKADEKYKPFQVVEGKITNIKEYGAFIELEPGISGLLQSSEIKNGLKQGDTISVCINKIDKINKKVYLSVGEFNAGVVKTGVK